MAFDAPKLGGYTLSNPPNTMSIIPEAIQQNNELADGGMKQRILGYRIHATLDWSDNWIRRQDLTGLIAVANDTTAALTFFPRPSTFASKSYQVIWINKFQFSYHNGHYNYWGGSIELVTPTTTSTISQSELP